MFYSLIRIGIIRTDITIISMGFIIASIFKALWGILGRRKNYVLMVAGHGN